MPGRHIAPRHRAPRSLTRSVARFAADVALPGSRHGVTSTVALVGAAGVAVGAGVFTVNTDTDAAPVQRRPGRVRPPTSLTRSVSTSTTGGSDDVSRSVARQPLVSAQRADKAARSRVTSRTSPARSPRRSGHRPA